ncbi:peptidase S8 [Actinosynnema sp. ALI-1.44]|uniref:S8 family serine peptidase n=1 Tax=Actinosynnema sp. ALI-1.44 TaxID=1933779 RepID=UPI00097C5DC5|nr:S8 family serine peptidase [Actinosynnema sp. ALI-1.44]ONI70279.1 peptidase S8 [Actinosynnema sp. ALI-1.44]
MAVARRTGWKRRRPMIAVLTLALVASVSTAGTATSRPRDLPLAKALPVRALPDSTADKVSELFSTSGPTTAFVELDRRPAVDVYNEQSSRAGGTQEQAAQAARAAVADTNATAESLSTALRSRDTSAQFLFTTVNAVAGMVVSGEATAIRGLAARADVQSIRPVLAKTRTNASAVQVTKTLNVWQNTGRLGDKIRIGVIDDGVDYTHATFGGPGTPESYTAIDRTKVDPSYFPTAKVVGGYDFAGDQYDASGKNGSKTPAPDPNPIACGEHGTHVGGTTAGYGVNADGTTFRGDYAKLTPQALDDMRIGPGTAPMASIYAIKVFGCSGGTNLTAKALDWALDPTGDGDFSDHLDVVNLSLGSNYGAPDDPDSLFVRKLVRNDVLPVIAGGNGGDIYDIGGAPGNTPEALTVASTLDPFVMRDAVTVTAPPEAAADVGGQYGLAYTAYDSLDLTQPVVRMSSQANADGCDPFAEADKTVVAGKIVWLEWDDADSTRRCGSAARATNAKNAGAAGVLLPSGTDQFAAGIAGVDGIPSFQLTATATKAVLPALQAGTLTVRMHGAKRGTLKTKSPEINDTPSRFTSRGVRGPAVKPDVAAPGDTIASALATSGNQVLVISGTSMATPHVAGIAALVRETRPDWTPEEVKAAVMNTATEDVRTEPNGIVLAPQRTGAGRVNAQSAVDTEVLAMVQEAPGSVSVSFGAVEVLNPVSVSRTVKLVNKGSQPTEFKAAYQDVTTMPGVRYEVSPSQVALPANGTAAVTVTLRVDDPLALRRTIDPTVARKQQDVARQFVADASGRIVLTSTAGKELRVPVYAAPKPVAKVSTEPVVSFDSTDQGLLPILGKGLDQGEGSEAYRSLISVLELQGTSPQLPSCRRVRVKSCTVNDTAKGGDIRYVGVASTAPWAIEHGKPDTAYLAFGVVTWGNRYNSGGNTIPYVKIDKNNDGTMDFQSYVTKLTGTDVWVVNTVDLAKPDRPSVARTAFNGLFGDTDTNAFDSDVALLPVPLRVLGVDLAAGSARFSYSVGVVGFYSPPGEEAGLIDSVAGMSFDPLKPALRATGQGKDALVFDAKANTVLSIKRDKSVMATDRTEGLLVLNHHNASGDRAAVVRVPAS